MADITFSPLRNEEIDDLTRLAHRIWHAHYPGIITVEQIDYMLKRGYTRTVIENEISALGIFWIAIKDGDDMIGFISVGPHGEGIFKLHKLYLLPEYHGLGIGSQALAETERIARQQKVAKLVLNVNRHNPKAISAYKRAGWQIAEETVVEIGGGYVMDDYLMVKNIST